MTAHTPGPWKAEPGSHKNVYIIHYSRGPLAIVNVGGKAPIDGTNEANAHLMAAAPDLLAACQAFVEAWEKSHQLEKTDIALRMAKQAIEKALLNEGLRAP